MLCFYIRQVRSVIQTEAQSQHVNFLNLIETSGDVLLKLFGIIHSLPAFLAGHVVYCLSFARGADLRVAHFRRFHPLKKALLFGIVVYAVAFFFLLESKFESSLKIVLALYIVAISSMFVLSLFVPR